MKAKSTGPCEDGANILRSKKLVAGLTIETRRRRQAAADFEVGIYTDGGNLRQGQADPEIGNRSHNS